VRWKNILLTMANFQLSRRAPALMKRLLRRGAQRRLPEGYEIDLHFKPRYDPWDQRLCIVPDGDLFAAIREGRASVATDAIETFTERGVRLASGAELEADLVVTATGLNLLALGGMELSVDGRDVVLAERLAYKGLMLSDVPNLAIALGYTNASWTLKCELICEYVCRLLAHMDARGYVQATPRPGGQAGVAPFLDLTSGYVRRSIADFPRQGAADPWRVHQSYLRDLRILRRGPVDDGMEFRTAPGRSDAPERGLVAA
jgi:monooxygenase